jgi:hypothetical protein
MASTFLPHHPSTTLPAQTACALRCTRLKAQAGTSASGGCFFERDVP